MKNNYLVYAFRIVVVIYTAIALYYFFGKPPGGGDEALFIADLEFIKNEGWLAAIKKGISIPFMILTYPVSLILENYLALRIVNLLLFGGLFLYFYKLKGLRSLNFYLLILFYFSTVGHFISGINDTLFVVDLTIFFTEAFFILSERKKASWSWLFIGLVIAIFTRALILVYVPVIVLCLILIFRKGRKPRWKQLIVPLLLLLGLISLNYPSLSENGKLSYDQKLPPSNVSATWPQRQYLAQLMVNEGSLPNHNHPTWKETDKYLLDNGTESLPKGILSGMTFNWKLTLKEFFKDFFEISLYGSRQLGPMLAIVLLFGFLSFWKKKKITSENLIPIALFLIMSIFALIIISYVELRWLSAIFLASIVYYYIMTEEGKISKVWVNLNLALLTIISLYGGYGILLKI